LDTLVVFIAAAAITILTEQEQVLFFVTAGILYMFLKSPPKLLKIIFHIVLYYFKLDFGNLKHQHLKKLQSSLQKLVHLFLAVV